MAREKQTGALSHLHTQKVTTPLMVNIPEGPFVMGTSEEQIIFLLSREEWAHEWYENDLFLIEQPQSSIDIPAFQISKYPVTNIDYYVFIFKTGYKLPKTWSGFHFPEDKGDHPVTGISRNDCLAYIEWLNQQTKKEFRLPTEAEWEKACRGMDTRIYPWGEDFDPWRCNTQESGKSETSPVGSYSPSGDSPYGAADMVGNVWEWTSSMMFPYPYRYDDGREEIDPVGKYVVRGGAWYYSKKLARCSAREGVIATYISPSLGFRLACNAEENQNNDEK